MAVNAPKARKGAFLTMDALLALALLLLSILFIMMLLNRQISYQAFGFESASDAMNVMRTLTLENLTGNPRYPYVNQVIEDELTNPYNQTMVEVAGDLYLAGHAWQAYNFTQEVIASAVPNEYGIELLIEEDGEDCQGATSNFSCIYNVTRGASKNFVSVDRHFVYYNNVTREIRLVLYK